MNTPDLLEDSDTSDDDYVPDQKQEILSEEDSDGDAENLSGSENEGHRSKKRSKGSSKSLKKHKKCAEKSTGEGTDEGKANHSNTKPTEDDKKKLEDDIWADFMKDTGFQSRKTVTGKLPGDKPQEEVGGSKNEKKLMNKSSEKVKITQLFEFAGEEVRVEKEVAADSAEARLLDKSSSEVPNTRKGGLSGIGSVLSQLGKKPKISTLEKTKLDWDKFKKEENLEEEIQTHNKGKDGYLERQDFLQRADLRRFEIEKGLRTIERNKRLNN